MNRRCVGMSATESRVTTIGVGCFAVGSIVFFLVVFAPALSSFEPGSSVRPWSVVTLLALFLANSGWLACLIAGISQLFSRPRYYGFISIGIGVLQFAAYQLTEWLLMGLRGLYWSP